MFYRQIIEELKEWKNREDRKPLVLRGARQVGKTTIINELGKLFNNYLYFNLDEKEDLNMWERDLPLDDLINSLFARRKTQKKNGSTLIFIDEIQNSPRTISLLRYFKEKRADIHVIAAGSVLENTVDMNASFPVGRVEYLALHPCSFKEFIGAMGKDNLLYFIQNEEQSEAVHDELLSLFNQYVIVGGMPEAVKKYAETRDVLQLDRIYTSLYQGYTDDVEKYVRLNRMTDIVRALIRKSWAHAGEIINLGNFADLGYKSKDINSAFRLLEKAMLLELVYPCTSTSVPALGEEKRHPKLIMLDTGLTNFYGGVRDELINSDDILDVWKGKIAEQVVAQELLTLNNNVTQRRQFWMRSESTAEVDFVWQRKSRLYPIEVKSGRNSHLRSLHSFIDLSKTDLAIRIWSGKYSVEKQITTIGRKKFRLINLPFYLIGELNRLIDKNA